MAISLEKREKTVGIILQKKGIDHIPCQVKLAIDRSGSMDNLYRNKIVQDVVERMLAISLNVDMDGTIDMWAFNNRSYPLKPVVKTIIENYIKREIEDKISSGGTSYSPVFENILKDSKASPGFFGFGKKEADPVLAIIITDGENEDRAKAEEIINESQSENIYWLMIGIGDEHFSFLKKIGDKFPNVGFVPIADISAIDDEDMYEAIFNPELVAWFGKFKK